MIVCADFEMVNDLSMFAAAFQTELPDCDARIVQVPSASIVTFAPLTVHTDVVRLEKVGLRPDDAVADTAKGDELYVRFDNVPNVID